MKVTVRVACEDDLTDIERITGQWLEKNESRTLYERLEDVLSSPSDQYSVLVAVTKEGTVFGFIVSKAEKGSDGLSGKTIHITDLFVDRHCQGQGVATMLVSKLEKLSNKNGYSRVRAEANEVFRESGWGFWDKRGDYERLFQYRQNGHLTTVWEKVV